jgi:hypothetical protein
MRPRTLIWIGSGLVLLGIVTLKTGAALAALLVTTCDNRFEFGNAPSLRCLQPALLGIAGWVLCLLGLTSGGAGLVVSLRRRRAP